MSCKILRPGDGVVPANIVWRKLGYAPPPHAPSVSTQAAPVILPNQGASTPREDYDPAELARREEAARRAGYQEGEAAATRAAEAKLQEALGRAAAAVQGAIETRHRMRRQMEEDLVHLAVAIARRILHRELQVDPEALGGVVKAAIQKLDARELHRVRACPIDAPIVERFISQSPLPARVEIVPDPSLERGALILETARGHLDASIESQLREVDRGLTDMVKRV